VPTRLSLRPREPPRRQVRKLSPPSPAKCAPRIPAPRRGDCPSQASPAVETLDHPPDRLREPLNGVEPVYPTPGVRTWHLMDRATARIDLSAMPSFCGGVPRARVRQHLQRSVDGAGGHEAGGGGALDPARPGVAALVRRVCARGVHPLDLAVGLAETRRQSSSARLGERDATRVETPMHLAGRGLSRRSEDPSGQSVFRSPRQAGHARSERPADIGGIKDPSLGGWASATSPYRHAGRHRHGGSRSSCDGPVPGRSPIRQGHPPPNPARDPGLPAAARSRPSGSPPFPLRPPWLAQPLPHGLAARPA
jgi:hypothetical protein